MAGFFDRFSNAPAVGVSDALKRISSLGMKYDDMIIKQSRAIGTTEAQLGGGDFNPRDLLYSLALSDVSQKKYTPIFDKDYPEKVAKLKCSKEVPFSHPVLEACCQSFL